MPHAEPVRLAAVALLATLAAACVHDRYADRRDQVTFGTGDSIAANKAIQIIDPWARESRNVSQGISGEQAEAAMEKFRKRASAQDITAAPPPALTLSPTPTAAPKTGQ
jgi:hypothetical protein